MFDPSNLFNAILIIPILNVLIGLYQALLFLKIPGAMGFSLILLTVLIRLILHPLTVKQLESAHKMSRLKPELDKLQQKFKDDKQKLHSEQLRLYQEAGINPAAGCLPLLLQMPILIALYNLFFQLLDKGDVAAVIEGINKVVYFPFLRITSFDLSFFGLSLAHKPNEWQKLGWWLLLVPVITGLLQYWQTKLMVPPKDSSLVAPIKSGPSRGEPSGQAPKPKEEKKEDDMSTVMQKQMTFMMPLMIGFFAYSFPIGLSLYWNTFTVFGIIQQYQLNERLKPDEKNSSKNKN